MISILFRWFMAPKKDGLVVYRCFSCRLQTGSPKLKLYTRRRLDDSLRSPSHPRPAGRRCFRPDAAAYRRLLVLGWFQGYRGI